MINFGFIILIVCVRQAGERVFTTVCSIADCLLPFWHASYSVGFSAAVFIVYRNVGFEYVAFILYVYMNSRLNKACCKPIHIQKTGNWHSTVYTR